MTSRAAPTPTAADAGALKSASKSPAGEPGSTTTKKTCKNVAIVITVKRQHTAADAVATMGTIDVRRVGDAGPAVKGDTMEQPAGTRDLHEGAGMKHYPVPAGTYPGVVVSSDKNHKLNPHTSEAVEILIPGWVAVLIHIGNFPKDSAGCILPGSGEVVTPASKNKAGKAVPASGEVTGSQGKTQEIMNFIYDVKDKENGGVMPKITVIIQDP
jgi:Family of unknown function (DUF5675)